uniref:dolichyl-phosphooligosaccharide-protein glycotransferase n=1 Tax=Candidatus Methanophaga sp. ANME-1 ERB7 TaxID=2759913 RepID=A0A7G9Z4B0_9EURY|nr:dolichyl-phosphooligosaccharide-protein glycotransferase 3 [Methanosarcinales archaeon ANME-1 ERB7]
MNTRIKNIEKTSLISGTILAFIFCLSLYIRVAIPYNTIFTDSFVRFGGCDAWYNMRLVENTLHHFPLRIYFDPFTAYPHGAYNPFGAPLFDLSLAFIIWMIGLGNPFSTLSQQGIEAIGAWYPAVLGALTVFPVYFIGKELYNRGAGLLSAALIAILPGPFLIRSLLGFTDHHAMETLFSTIAMLFFILAVKSAREKEITFYSILRKDWRSLKKPLIYSFLAGFFIGSYFLSWVGAPLFIFILILYALVQHVADHLRGASTDYLCIVSMPVFIIPLAMIAPALSFGFLSEFHALSLLLGIIVFLVLTTLSFSMKKIKPYVYPLAILAIGITSFILLKVFDPSLYSTLTEPLLYVFAPPKPLLTIAEVQPMGWNNIWNWFTTTFFLAYAALALIFYNISRKWRAEEILLVVWSVVMLFISLRHTRFAFYYAVNVAILCGFLSWKIIEFVEFRGEKVGGIEKSGEKLKEKKESKVKGTRKREARGTQKSKAKGVKAKKKFLRADIIFPFIVILFVVFCFPLNESLTMAKRGGIKGPSDDWYEALSWMRENTPDPGVDYYALYPEDYTYPESAYSVMSWWDYGHWITRIAHRIPVANNFQQGIGGPHQGNTPGACVFFITKNESEANKVADALDMRYVVTDFMMADAMESYNNKYWAIALWANETPGCEMYLTERGTVFKMDEKYFNTMVTKLHMFDGREIIYKGEYVGKSSSIMPFHTKPLRHYRLVYESSKHVFPHVVLNAATEDVQAWKSYHGMNYTEKLLAFEQELHSGFHDPKNPDLFRWTPSFISPVSFVKVFEYVKGARIKGSAPNGSIVAIVTNITTNQGREFIYSQTTISNGSYEFVVPYSTEGPVEGGTNFDVLASPYIMRSGHLENETIAWDIEKEVEVDEREVIEGKTVSVDLLLLPS